MSKLFISYVRNEKRCPIGIMVALKYNYTPHETLLLVGWSALNPVDNFNRKLGLKIAENRAKRHWYGYLAKTANVPVKLVNSMGPFVEKAAKYFKIEKPEIEFKTNYRGKL